MVNVGGRIRAASLFLLMMLVFAPRVFAQNLSNYTGAISITGNQTGGADSISHVNWDSVVDPRPIAPSATVPPRWLAHQVVELKIVERASDNTIGRVLKK